MRTGDIFWENLPNNCNRRRTISKSGDCTIEDEGNKLNYEQESTEIYSINFIDEYYEERTSKEILDLKYNLNEENKIKDVFYYDKYNLS